MTNILKKIVVTIAVFLMALSPVRAYEALIFDCDGVLVDTEHLKFLAWHQALVNINIDYKESDYFPLVGQSSATIAKTIKQENKIQFSEESVISQKDKIYSRLQKQGVPQFNEAVNFLKLAITKKNQLKIKIAIASSAPHSEILENLRQLEISPADLDAILSGSDDLKHICDPEGTNKPKPYIYQLAAQKLDVQPTNCLVFEDSGAGVIAAATAKMKVIAVPNAYTEKHNFSLAMKIATFKEMNLSEIIKASKEGVKS